MKSGVMSRILLWKSIEGRNPTKSVTANKDGLFRHVSFFEISRFFVNEKRTENMEEFFRKGNYIIRKHNWKHFNEILGNYHGLSQSCLVCKHTHKRFCKSSRKHNVLRCIFCRRIFQSFKGNHCLSLHGVWIRFTRMQPQVLAPFLFTCEYDFFQQGNANIVTANNFMSAL